MPAFGQGGISLKNALNKLDNQSIYETARIGTPQTLLVTLDAAPEMEMIKQKHKQLHDKRRAAGAVLDEKKLSEDEETALIEDKKNEIDKIKRSIFPENINGRTKITEDFSHIPIVKVRITDVDALIELLKNPRVKSVSHVPGAVSTGSNNLNIIGQPVTASAGKIGSNTRVVVLDTGLFNQNAPELAGKIVDAIEWNFNTGAQVPLCSSWGCTPSAAYHGQSVASIVGLVAPGAKISFVRAVTGSGSDLIRSLNWVLQNYQRSPAVVAVNMSFALTSILGGANDASGTYVPLYTASCPQANSAINTLIAEIISHDIVVTAGSGNNYSASSIAAPACMPGVVAVGAVSDSIANGICSSTLSVDQVGCFSNSSILVKVLAPGVNISDSSNIGANSGTSMATPHVSGAVAVLRGANAYPGESNDVTMGKIYNTGKSVVDSRNSMAIPRLQLDQAAGSGMVRSPRSPKCSINPALCA